MTISVRPAASRRLIWTALAAVALATALFAVACTSKTAEASCTTAKECLPDVSYQGLLDKAVYPRADLNNKIVVVNFWATWCGPCKKEIPAFNQIYTEYAKHGVVMLGVLYDNQVDDAGLLNFMSDFEMSYPVVRADQTVLDAYERPRALPTTFVYDRAGKLVTEHKGPMSEAQLRAALDAQLK